MPIDDTRRKFDPARKLRVFFSGLKLAIWLDISVAYKIFLSFIVLGMTFWLREWFDFLLILVVTGLLLVAEIFNTAIEEICDYVQPKHDPKIGVIKDIASSAVGISIFVWVCTLLLEVWRIWNNLG